MGYHTDLEGSFDICPALTVEDFKYLNEFNEARHEEAGVPDLYCPWVPNRDGDELEWDGGEKPYAYVEWLEYLIENFFGPKGYSLMGDVYWYGDETDDRGLIEIRDSIITVKHAVITYE